MSMTKPAKADIPNETHRLVFVPRKANIKPERIYATISLSWDVIAVL